MSGIKQRGPSADQLVATSPPVKWASEEAEKTIVTVLKTQYDNAVNWAQQQTAAGDGMHAEIEQWAQEIRDHEQAVRERNAWIERRTLELRQARLNAQTGRDVAKGAADTLALVGSPIPPANGELSHDPDGTLDRFDAAHDQQQAAEAVRS